MKINVNETILFYEKSGGGEPLLLLHGNGEDHHIFDPLAKKLSRHYTVYAIDSRNHGASKKTSDISYAHMMRDIYEFICSLHLAPVSIVGFSDGAIVSLMLAMQYGELINKMALLGVNLKPDDFTDESYAFIKNMYEDTKDPLFRLMLEEPDIGLEDVKSVQTSTLIIAGEQDIFKPDTFTNLEAAMPNAELRIMQGHEHDSYIVENDLLYPELLSFFE